VSKYGNRKVKLNGHCFDSVAERNRYLVLDSWRQHGEIKELELQPKFLLQEGFVYNGKNERAINYIADFKYIDTKTNQTIIEDVKGVATPEYKIKRKLFLNKYGENLVFKEIPANKITWGKNREKR
jgi:hypothetical protein